MPPQTSLIFFPSQHEPELPADRGNGRTVRAFGASFLPPDVRTCDPLPPLDDYYRIGEARKVSWSLLRTQILALLWTTRAALGPYDIADRLSGDGVKRHPNSIYRSLKAFAAAGLVVPIVTLSRYAISPDPDFGCWGVIVCAQCRDYRLVRMSGERRRLWSLAGERDFRPERATMECVATCAACSGLA